MNNIEKAIRELAVERKTEERKREGKWYPGKPKSKPEQLSGWVVARSVLYHYEVDWLYLEQHWHLWIQDRLN